MTREDSKTATAPDGRREIARELARDLEREDVLRAFRRAEALAEASDAPEDPAFEDALAAVEEAAAKPCPPRPEDAPRTLLFLGESAAAGYLYAPRRTPAGVLAAMLRQGGGEWDVQDLARTNQTLAGLLGTLAGVENADVLVIYTGNNWELLENPQISPYAPSVRARLIFARELRNGADGPATLARRRLRKKARRAFAAVERLARRLGAEVVLVLPEVDADDWEVLQPASFGEAPREPRPASGRAAVDGECVDRMALLGAPRATSEVRRLLAAAAREHGWTSVDLREVFRDCSETTDFFLDYCHLTARGMDVAMASVASAVNGNDVPAGVPAAGAPAAGVPVDGAVEALARLGAAVHAAHRHPPTPRKPALIERRLREALAADPAVAGTFLDLAAARAAPLPAFLTAAQDRNLASPHPLGLQHGWRWPFVDADLLEAIARVLPDEADRIAGLLARGLAVTDSGRELAEPPFLWDPMERFFLENMDFADLDGRATLRSPLPWIRFALVLAEPREVELDVTARLPGGQEDGRLHVELNGEVAAHLDLGATWRRQRVRLPASSARRGLNCLRFAWPSAEPAEGTPSATLEAARRCLELGREADFHPIYGEVASVMASIPPESGDAG